MDPLDHQEYEMLLLLEQLETLREDMEELGVTSIAELDARIAALQHELERLGARS
jgi:uncharacterized small protein (DUF1192 family)